MKEIDIKIIDKSLDKLVEKIASKSTLFVLEHEAFNKKANKQAAKRARVLSNELTALLKLYRKESIKVIKKL